MYISSYSVQSNSSNSNNLVQQKCSFCLHTAKGQNISTLNNSVQRSTVSMSKTVLFQTIQFGMSAYLHVKTVLFQVIQFSIFSCFYSGPKWTWERQQSRSTLHSPYLQHYWNLTIRLFSVISRILVRGDLLLNRDAVGVFCIRCQLGHRTHVGGVILLCRDAVGVFYSPSRLCKLYLKKKDKTIQL